MCDLETWVEREGEIHIFSASRAHSVEYCHAYMREWKKLTRSEEFVCIDGENDGEDTEKVGANLKLVHLWDWKKFKTSKGCYSYRKGDCDEFQICSH